MYYRFDEENHLHYIRCSCGACRSNQHYSDYEINSDSDNSGITAIIERNNRQDDSSDSDESDWFVADKAVQNGIKRVSHILKMDQDRMISSTTTPSTSIWDEDYDSDETIIYNWQGDDSSDSCSELSDDCPKSMIVEGAIKAANYDPDETDVEESEEESEECEEEEIKVCPPEGTRDKWSEAQHMSWCYPNFIPLEMSPVSKDDIPDVSKDDIPESPETPDNPPVILKGN